MDFNDYIGLIKKKAKIYSWVYSDFDDFYQTGCLVFMKANNKYDPLRGIPFSSYLGLCLDRELLYQRTKRYFGVTPLTKKKNNVQPILNKRVQKVEDLMETIEQDWRREEVEKAMEHLKKKERYLIQRVIFDGCPLVQVAAEMGKTEYKTKKILNRAKAKLRELLKEAI